LEGKIVEPFQNTKTTRDNVKSLQYLGYDPNLKEITAPQTNKTLAKREKERKPLSIAASRKDQKTLQRHLGLRSRNMQSKLLKRPSSIS
jgi:hypothetical protein